MSIFKLGHKTKMPTLEQNLLLIQQIHQDFYNQQHLLKTDLPVLIKEQKQLIKNNSQIVEQQKSLLRLGFNQSKTTLALEKIVNANKEAEAVLAKMEITLEALKIFNREYPKLKCITISQVVKLCKKYGFICGPVNAYIGTIPEENIAEMSKIEISNNYKLGGFGNYRWNSNRNKTNGQFYNAYSTEYASAPLEIIAPKNEFNLSNLDFKDNYFLQEKIKPVVYDDPIVLQPVVYEGYKYYLILTAWGPEASDPLVQKQSNNLNNQLNENN